MKKEEALFAAGCFWGVEVAFAALPGVLETKVGYAGGHTDQPTYEQVCGGGTGHAEVVRVVYDPDRISYKELLKEFFRIHNPTTLNRQGPDVGSQYRSAIFYRNDEEKTVAEEYIKELEAGGSFSGPIVTEVTKAGPFFLAEEYHQKYLEKTGQGVCH